MNRDLALAFESSSRNRIVGLVRANEIIELQTEDHDRGRADRLIPLAEKVLSSARIGWTDITAIGVCVGPGNYTGIRVGVSAARGLSMSLGIPAIGVNLFDALSLGLDEPLLTVVEARHDRFYCRLGCDGDPFISDFETLDITGKSDLIVVGYESKRLAEMLGVNFEEAKFPIGAAIGFIALARMTEINDRPAPMYVIPLNLPRTSTDLTNR